MKKKPAKPTKRASKPLTPDQRAARAARHVAIDPDIADTLSDLLAEALVNSFERDREAKSALMSSARKWRIPARLEREVIERDRTCVYRRIELGSASQPGRARATWEHIVNDSRIVTRENIARCCNACNASKGTQALSAWLGSTYCQRRGITHETVADVVRQALGSQKKPRA